MEYSAPTKIRALGMLADWTMAFGIFLAFLGIAVSYYGNLPYAIRIEGLALILIAASVVAAFRGIAAALKDFVHDLSKSDVTTRQKSKI